MLEIQKDSFDYSGFYRATVVDNVDSSKLGRIKVQISGIFKSDIPTSQLPWAVPAYPIFTGAGVGYGSFAVPEIGSFVFVFFEGRDVYQPVYFLEAPSGVHGLPAERITNYPFRKVIKTKNGITVYIDDSSKEIKVSHPTGTYLEIDTNGKVTVIGGDITITGEAVVIEGDTVNINP